MNDGAMHAARSELYGTAVREQQYLSVPVSGLPSATVHSHMPPSSMMLQQVVVEAAAVALRQQQLADFAGMQQRITTSSANTSTLLPGMSMPTVATNAAHGSATPVNSMKGPSQQTSAPFPVMSTMGPVSVTVSTVLARPLPQCFCASSGGSTHHGEPLLPENIRRPALRRAWCARHGHDEHDGDYNGGDARSNAPRPIYGGYGCW